jgi:hypothetical protein
MKNIFNLNSFHFFVENLKKGFLALISVGKEFSECPTTRLVQYSKDLAHISLLSSYIITPCV